MTQAPASDDVVLVERLRAGDEEAFADLVMRWSRSMLRVALMYVPSRAVAEEVVQETWLGVLTGLERFEGRSSLRTWVFSILVNRARTRGERERRTFPFSLDDEEPVVDPARFDRSGGWLSPPARWEESPERSLDSGEAVALVQGEIEKLPAMQRAVITMRDLDDWTGPEVAAALEVSEANQRVLLHRARSKVRNALEDYFA